MNIVVKNADFAGYPDLSGSENLVYIDTKDPDVLLVISNINTPTKQGITEVLQK